MTDEEQDYEALQSGGGMHQVFKHGQVVIRETGPLGNCGA